MLSDRSRIAFLVDAALPLPFDAEALPAACAASPLAATGTGLEVPFRLLLAPASGARFTRAKAPVRVRNRSELWTTRFEGDLHVAQRLGTTPDPLGAAAPLDDSPAR